MKKLFTRQTYVRQCTIDKIVWIVRVVKFECVSYLLFTPVAGKVNLYEVSTWTVVIGHVYWMRSACRYM